MVGHSLSFGLCHFCVGVGHRGAGLWVIVERQRGMSRIIVKDTERRGVKESTSREVWKFDDFVEDVIKMFNTLLHDLPEGGLRWAI